MANQTRDELARLITRTIRLGMMDLRDPQSQSETMKNLHHNIIEMMNESKSKRLVIKLSTHTTIPTSEDGPDGFPNTVG